MHRESVRSSRGREKPGDIPLVLVERGRVCHHDSSRSPQLHPCDNPATFACDTRLTGCDSPPWSASRTGQVMTRVINSPYDVQLQNNWDIVSLVTLKRGMPT